MKTNQVSLLCFSSILLALIASESLPANVRLDPAEGPPGTTFSVIGTLAPGSPGVRVLWDDGTTARGLAEGPLGPDGGFDLDLQVPADAPPGRVTIMAFASGSLGDDIASANFTVLASRPGSVSGLVQAHPGGVNLPIPNATVKLVTPEGNPVATTVTDAQGNYTFPNVTPGLYTLLAGADDFFAPAGEIDVPSGGNAANNFEMAPLEALPAPAVVTFVAGIALPTSALLDFGSPVLVTSQATAKQSGVIAHFASLPPAASGVHVRFWADAAFPSGTPENQRAVTFEVLGPSGESLYKVKKTVRAPVDASTPGLDFSAYTSSLPGPIPIDMNVSSFPPGELFLRVTPSINNQYGYGKLYIIKMTDLANRWFKPWVQIHPDPDTLLPIRYNVISGNLAYLLNASLPNSSLLPFALDIPVPVFDYTFQNRLGLSVPQFQEVFLADPRKGLRFGVAKPILQTELKIFSRDFSPDPRTHSPISDPLGNVTEYDLPRQTILGPADLLNVVLYQNGPGIGCVNLCIFGCEVCAGWKVYVDFTLGGLLDLESHIYPDLALDTTLTPQVLGTIGGHARVKLVVCSLNADITGTVGVDFPFRYRSNPDSAGFENPCIHLSGSIGGDIGCLGIGFGGGGSIGPYNLFGCSESAEPSLSTRVTTQMSVNPMHVDPAPSVTAGGDGQALSVWVQDEDTTGSQMAPFIYYRFHDSGVWLPPQRLTPSAALVNDPKAVLLSDQRAVALWAQNTQPLSEIHETGMAHLAYQEIYSSIWDGSAWSTPLPLTENTVAEGSISLAASLDGNRAIAAWTHIQEPPQEDPDQVNSNLEFAIFSGGAWGPPEALHLENGKIDSQVTVKFDAAGNTWAVWMRDDDADLTTFADRQIWLATTGRSGWNAPERIAAAPAGAFSPTLALDADNQPVVLFLVPPQFQGELTSGLGNRSSLWFARRSAQNWAVQQITVADSPVYGEDPSLEITPENKAIIVLRRFDDDTLHQTGDLSALTATLSLPAVQFTGDWLTRDGQSNWKVSFALDPQSLRSYIASVKQSPFGRGFIGADLQAHHLGALSLSRAALDGPMVANLALDFTPDLDITPEDITLSHTHPIPGDTVTISARIHNRGLQDLAAPVVVKFYDVPVLREAVPFAQTVLEPPLPLGQSLLLQAQYPVTQGGLRNISVQVDAGRELAESNEDNNLASLPLGEVEPPSGLIVTPDPALPAHILTWDPPASAGQRQYQIYRAEGDSPFELVGATSTTTFTDYLVTPGAAYRYALSATDQFDVTSPTTETPAILLPPPPPNPPPAFTILAAQSQVHIAWFDPQNQFILQSASDLRQPILWDRISEPPFDLQGHKQLILTPATTRQFFRLLKP